MDFFEKNLPHWVAGLGSGLLLAALGGGWKLWFAAIGTVAIFGAGNAWAYARADDSDE